MDPQNPYLSYIKSFASVFEKGKDLPLVQYQHLPKQTNQSALKVVILSPHPDDECVMGAHQVGGRQALPFLMAHYLWQFSAKRKEKELSQACKWLARFEMAFGGLDQIRFKVHESQTLENCGTELAEVIQKINPDILFLPNSTD